MIRRLGILAFCIATAVGCTDSLFTSPSGDGAKKPDDDEGSDPPANVNGSFYLTCQFVNLAQPARPEADLGCVVKDEKQNKKVVITDVATSFDWNTAPMPPEQQQGVEVRITPYGDSNPDFHVLYTFAGTNASVVNDVAIKTTIQMYVKPLQAGQPEVKAFEATVSQATQSQVATESDGIFGDNGTPKDPTSVPNNLR